MKRKQMTMKELHTRMAVSCKHCHRPVEEHIPIMVPEKVEYRCADMNVFMDDTYNVFEVK